MYFYKLIDENKEIIGIGKMIVEYLISLNSILDKEKLISEKLKVLNLFLLKEFNPWFGIPKEPFDVLLMGNDN